MTQSSLCCPHDECDHRAGDRDYGRSSGMAQDSQLNKIVTIEKDTVRLRNSCMGRGMTSLVKVDSLLPPGYSAGRH